MPSGSNTKGSGNKGSGKKGSGKKGSGNKGSDNKGSGSGANTGFAERYSSPPPGPVPDFELCAICDGWNAVGEAHTCQAEEQDKDQD